MVKLAWGFAGLGALVYAAGRVMCELEEMSAYQLEP
jgi:hypothetical protein